MSILPYILFFLPLLLLAGEDYYKLLGVSRTASDQEIKRAFKKLSLKHHPDKNRDNPEKAKDMFAKIVNAYEVLKDSESRKIYDQKGEEGVRQHQAGQSQQGGGFQGNFEDIFSNFFGGGGGGGGGGGFHFNFGGGGGFPGGGFGGQQRQQQKEPENIFENTEVYVINLGSLSRFFRRSEVWLILFYKNEQKESKEMKDLWKDLADKYYGIFKVAAVNCQTDQELCEDEFRVFETPTVLAYTSSLKSEGEEYKGDFKNQQSLANFAVSFMESYVLLVKDENYQEFINSENEKNKVLLFTAKKTTPPLFKALSKDMKGKLVFGEVRQTAKTLLEKFNVQNFPSLIVLTDPENYKGVIYEGSYKKDQIMKFLREYSYNPSKKKKTASGSINLLTHKYIKNQQKCGSSDANLCFILLVNQNTRDNLVEVLKNIADEYKDDPVNFVFADENDIDFQNIFEKNTEFTIPAIVVAKTKRMRAVLYNGEMSQDKIKNFLDETLGGSGTFSKMSDSLENLLTAIKTDL